MTKNDLLYFLQMAILGYFIGLSQPIQAAPFVWYTLYQATHHGADAYSSIDLHHLILEYSRLNQVPVTLVTAIMMIESNHFDPCSTSSKGAVGLMQLLPTTASDLGVTDPYKPSANVEGGIRYLAQAFQQSHHNYKLTAAYYNAGPKILTEPPSHWPTETRVYALERLPRALARIRRLGWRQVVPASVANVSSLYCQSELADSNR